MHKATVFRMLNTLEALGYVQKNPKTEQYGLTLKFLTISSAGLSHYNIKQQLAPILHKLSEEFGETVHLVERSENSVIYIDKYESEKNSVRMVSHIGMKQNITTTAVGKALLATDPEKDIRLIWDKTEHTAKTPYTITNYRDFLTELNEIRKKGYAVDNEENELGVRCVAVSVKDAFGVYKHAVSISAPINRMDNKTVEKISKRMLELLK